MILPTILLTKTANRLAKYEGLDSIEECLDKNYFSTYPHEIHYQYNSRGFRDEEWPTNLNNVVWCLGDSFTVGLGSPTEHLWVKILEKKISQKCINVSMNGASNHWIARQAKEILKEIQPDLMCIHWSFLMRREKNSNDLDENRRIQYGIDSLSHYINNIEFLKLFHDLENIKGHTKLVHTILLDSDIFSLTESNRIWKPIAGDDWGQLPMNSHEFHSLPSFIHTEMKSLGLWHIYEYFRDRAKFCDQYYQDPFEKVSQLDEVIDFARDRYHYGPATASKLVDIMLEQINIG